MEEEPLLSPPSSSSSSFSLPSAPRSCEESFVRLGLSSHLAGRAVLQASCGNRCSVLLLGKHQVPSLYRLCQRFIHASAEEYPELQEAVMRQQAEVGECLRLPADNILATTTSSLEKEEKESNNEKENREEEGAAQEQDTDGDKVGSSSTDGISS